MPTNLFFTAANAEYRGSTPAGQGSSYLEKQFCGPLRILRFELKQKITQDRIR
jgi:hypothetical protein